MRCVFLILISFFIIISCKQKEQEKVDEKIIEDRLNSLNRTANKQDLDGFMDHFVKSDSTLFIFNADPAFGWENIKIRQEEWWNNVDTAHYRIYNQIIIPLSDSAFTATNIATSWVVTRNGEEKMGRFIISMTWIKTIDGWKIIEAHESTSGLNLK
ncbi:DUF3225 domain-containing protein [Mangrovivirga sp. M17]|uniref:DUF3225 domain-containing protein n=1 Tax=Mangrovivirga halotolerans TaxID=2993936 RepID=A0ABT3RUU5_9BACT|nr:nuclear transport factor 2 family protein [Mangrovivirga halotolerans]MCX2745553.1 DUF3225 domain-containing protein [Mangrovivirga halotolerans]